MKAINGRRFGCAHYAAWLVMGLLLELSSRAHSAELDQIAFVYLKWGSNSVSLVSKEVRPGRLKSPPIREAGLRLHLVDAAGKILWAGSCEDARVRRHEFPDDENPTQLKQIQVNDPNAEWVVRVPVKEGAVELLVYGPLPPPADGVTQGVPAATPERPLIARIVWGNEGGTP